jgi:nucleoside-diphosphate-sugar epimerase
MLTVPGKSRNEGGAGMKVLVLGGTRYFGVHMVNSLIKRGHEVTIATRGRRKDSFGKSVERLIIERTDPESLAAAFAGRSFDTACDSLAFSSGDIRNLMDTLDCRRYVMTSSAAVYEDMHLRMKEDEFDPFHYRLRWGEVMEYGEGKRQAETALFQCYRHFSGAAVRLPFVIGEDDYTGRLRFYVENTINEEAMHVDNLDEQLSFIRSDEAGEFLSWTAEQEFTGPINASTTGTISVREIISYVEKKTGKKAKLSKAGLPGPYNGQESFSLDTSRAEALGFSFTSLDGWIFGLLDRLINKAITNNL